MCGKTGPNGFWLIEIPKHLLSTLGSCCSRGQSGSCPRGHFCHADRPNPSLCSVLIWVLNCLYVASSTTQKKAFTTFSSLTPLKGTQRAPLLSCQHRPYLILNGRNAQAAK